MKIATTTRKSLAQVQAAAVIPADVFDSPQPLDRFHLYNLVCNQIARLIDRGEYPRGTRLPGEIDLAARFGVSRPIVRRALAMLRDGGYLATRKGSGTLVTKDTPTGRPGFPALVEMGDLKHWYEYRVGLEAETAALAAVQRSAADLEQIEECLVQAEAALRAREPRLVSDLNFAFHRAVAAATANKFFIATFEALPNVVGETRASRGFGTVPENERRQRRLQAEHRQVLEAIRRRDRDAARTAMLDHVERSMSEVLRRLKVRQE